MKNYTFNSILFRQIAPLILVLFFSIVTFGQVSSVNPTRVTSQTVVTITGSNFTSTTLNSIALTNGSIGEKQLLDSNTMTFEITDTSTSSWNGNLSVSGSGVATLNYIAPVPKYLAYNYGVTKITEIYTKLDVQNGSPIFWRSGSNYADPENSHDLLGYKYNGVVYSTGVDDAMLEANLSSEIDLTSASEYVKQEYRAYSTNGVSGSSHRANYIVTGDYVDGEFGEGPTITSNNILGLTAYDVITDGVNGLDLGTGITNFNQTSNIRFFSGNGKVGAVDDNVPDLLITQIASPGGTDIYYYADENGNVVGKPIILEIMDDATRPGSESTVLSRWNVDLYSMYAGSYATSTPFEKALAGFRTIRMIALNLSDFGITGDEDTNVNTHLSSVNNVNMMAGGSSDMAFLAYNKSAFEIKAPTADAMLPRYVCRLPSTTDITFTVSASVEGGFTTDPKEVLHYEWFKFNENLSDTNASHAITNIDEDDIATYKVRVYNDYGSLTVPVELGQGGTPTFWNGSTWNVPAVYSSAGITIALEDRSLIFYDDYNENVDLEGCDCTVPAGYDVTIPSGKSLKIYDNIIVEPLQPEYVHVDNDTIPAVPAGTFTLENNASLVQINGEDNINEGIITMKRLADNIKALDYVYWSSPVEGFNVSGIPSSRTYKWDATQGNANGTTGDWLRVTSETMEEGIGYIARVPSATSFTTTFVGKPNTGNISVPVSKSIAPLPLAEDQHFNLIGNPYPSAVNAVKFITTNSNIDGKVRVWTHELGMSNTAGDQFYENFGYNYEDSYIEVNGTGSTPSTPSFDGNIAAGQAFFVKLTGSNDDTVEFTNAMRYDGSEDIYRNDEFFRGSSTEPEEKQLIWLSLVNEKYASKSTLIGYVDGATNQKDRVYDAPVDGDSFKVYSLISNERMVIQGRSLPFTDTDEVPLGIEVSNNGSYSIAIDNLEGSVFTDANQDIYLKDTYLNMEHDLRQSPYSFTAVSGVTNDRFVLQYRETTTLSVDELEVNNTLVYINNATLFVKAMNNMKSIQLFDFSGKQLANFTINSSSNRFNAPFPYSNGGYIISITLEDGRVVSKKLIN